MSSITTGYHVGDKVAVKGTGGRWKDLGYAATIVDVRASDDTVKVQYRDGGYKRFTRAKFNEIAKPARDTEYGSEAWELPTDQYDPYVEVIEEVSLLRAEVNKAVQHKDFKKAQRLKEKIQLKMEHAEEISQFKIELDQAVSKQDFLKADEVQARINALQGDVTLEQSVEGTPTGEVNFKEILSKAANRALGGGIAGAAAMATQVCTLLWLRTTMNYQYRNGGTTKEAFRILYSQGGIRRFYQGFAPALLQGPLSRFGDTAANTGVLTFVDAHPDLRDLPMSVKTLFASFAASLWRINLMPIDTLKTTMQVSGAGGFNALKAKVASGGIPVLYHGALAASAATMAGFYPWFFTYNMLSAKLPMPDTELGKLGRQAGMGFTASVVSDTCSNSIRVIKTYRQTSNEVISYPQAVKDVIAQDGVIGLFGRGLQTRILANGMQGLMFSVMWKYLDTTIQKWRGSGNEDGEATTI